MYLIRPELHKHLGLVHVCVKLERAQNIYGKTMAKKRKLEAKETEPKKLFCGERMQQ